MSGRSSVYETAHITNWHGAWVLPPPRLVLETGLYKLVPSVYIKRKFLEDFTLYRSYLIGIAPMPPRRVCYYYTINIYLYQYNSGIITPLNLFLFEQKVVQSVGFEPTRNLLVQRLKRPLVSTTYLRLHCGFFYLSLVARISLF